LNIVVTGGAGFIGYHLTEALLKRGNAITVYDNFSGLGSERIFELEEATLVRGDVLDPKELYKACMNAELIYHLAAQTSVPDSTQDPCRDMETNLRGTVNVLEAARRVRARVIFASSAAVYGPPEWNPISESAPLRPISFYGLSKKAAEEYCGMYQECYNVASVVMRIFNCYGPHCHGVVHDVIQRLPRSGGELTLLGEPDWTKDFVYISDLIGALLVALDLDSSSELYIFNIGSGSATRLVDLAAEICRQAGCRPALRFTERSWYGDVTNAYADITKAEEQLDWRPRISLPQGIAKTLRWFRSRPPLPQVQSEARP